MLANMWLAGPEEKHTRCVLSWDLQSPWICTIGSTQGSYRSKTSTEVLQHTKCSTVSPITRWESLVVASLQRQYLTREIHNRASVKVVGTLHKDLHITMQYQQHYQSMENTTKYLFLNTTWSVTSLVPRPRGRGEGCSLGTRLVCYIHIHICIFPYQYDSVNHNSTGNTQSPSDWLIRYEDQN